MQGPPPGHQQMTKFECSESIVGPTADLIGGGLATVFGLLHVALSNFDSGPDAGSGASIAILPLASGLGFGVSAIVGFQTASRCTAAKRDLAARVAAGIAVAGSAAPANVVAPTDTAAPKAPPVADARTGRTDTTTRGSQPRPHTFTIGVAGSTDTMVVGTSLQLLASARTNAGADVPNLRYRWTSSDATTATVGQAGRVTAQAPGAVTITAQFGAVAGSVTIVIVRR
jgi:hypothetical protein